jgi:tetratricopeptide (TPR) repeat protein
MFSAGACFMTRLWFCCLLACVLSVAAARAAGYDDFASGMSAVNRGDNDQAIAFFTSALAAGDLSASLAPVAYLERARAHLAKDECPQAAADAAAALKAKPVYFEASLLKARADTCDGAQADVIADLTQVIAIRPFGEAYFERALARWSGGDFEGAAGDFSTASSLTPEWAYPVIWFGLSKQRAGTFDGADFAKRRQSFDGNDWPDPVLSLYEGKAKPDDVLAVAGKGDAAKGNLCEAHFYIAEWWLIQKNADAARPLLQDAKSNCPRNFIEYRAAQAELGRLN